MKIITIPEDCILKGKEIDPQTGKVSDFEEPKPFKDFLQEAIDLNPDNGKGMKRVTQVVKIWKIIEAANGELILEDADYDIVKDSVEKAPFKAAFSRQVLPFFEAVHKAKGYEPPKEDKKK